MAIIGELSMDLARILAITRNKYYLHALSRVGVRSKFAHCYCFCVGLGLRYTRCTALSTDLDGAFPTSCRRSHEHTALAMEAAGLKELGDNYGIVSDLLVRQPLHSFGNHVRSDRLH